MKPSVGKSELILPSGLDCSSTLFQAAAQPNSKSTFLDPITASLVADMGGPFRDRTRWRTIIGFALMRSHENTNKPPVIFYSYSEKDKGYVKEQIIDDLGGNFPIVRNSMFVYGNAVVLAPMSNDCDPETYASQIASHIERISAFCSWCKSAENKPNVLLIPFEDHMTPQRPGHAVYLKVDFTQHSISIIDSNLMRCPEGRSKQYFDFMNCIARVIEEAMGLQLEQNIKFLETQKDLCHCLHYATLGIDHELTSQDKPVGSTPREFRETITSSDSSDSHFATLRPEDAKLLAEAYKAGEGMLQEDLSQAGQAVKDAMPKDIIDVSDLDP